MKTKHTAGPWVNHGLAIATKPAWCDGNKTEIEIATAHFEDNRIADEQEDSDSQYLEDYEEAYANASLIAAAPELLMALQSCITDDGACCWRTGNFKARLQAINDMARAAIAKATEAP